ncbi:MAG: ATPase [Clostridia bacterium]|nr:ATPase [Clostridia bacterium]
MAIEKMQLVTFTGKAGKLDKIISKCLLSGDFHPEQASDFIGFSEILSIMKSNGADDKVEDMMEYSTYDGKFSPSHAVQYLSSVLGYSAVVSENTYSGIMQSIKELADEYGFDIESTKVSKGRNYDEDDPEEYVLSVGERIKELDGERKELLNQLRQCEEGKAQFAHFKGLSIPLEQISESRFVKTRFGHMPRESVEKLNIAYSDNPYVLFVPCTTEADECWGAYVAPKNKLDEVDKIFSLLHFERLKMPGAVGSTAEVIESLDNNIEIISESVREYDRKIKEIFETEKEKLIAVYNHMRIKNAVYEVRKYVFVSGNSFFCAGWVPVKKLRSVTEKIMSFSGVSLTTVTPEEVPEHEPPVRLKNNKLTRPYEYYVEMYGLPKYHDKDITFFVAFVYTFVFGVMFGDVGQGLLLAIGGFLAYKLKGIALGKILVPCGVASMVGGFVFGSVFGFEHALDPLYHAIGFKEKPVEVMDSVNGILVFAIGIGVVLVIAAMVMNIIISLKRKKIGEALFSQNGLAGIVLYVCGVCLVYAFMGGPKLIPNAVLIPLMLVSFLMLFFKEILIGITDKHENWKPESMMDFFLQNIFECIEYVLSYFSNTLSFLRVGAFVIVHASMMMVVFTLAGDTSTPKGIIVVILGNIVVIALEGLLTGIQGLRLVFYEMFSRFHEGGGKPFNAISSKKL